MNSGTENGIGYFHQPDQELLLPLINGVMFNALLFYLGIFYFIPTLLKRREYKNFWITLTVIMFLYLVLKTVGEVAIIYFYMPSLSALTFIELVQENLYMFFTFAILGMIYGVIKDWVVTVVKKNTADDILKTSKAYVLVKSGTAIHRVKLDEIKYIKSDGNYVIFHLDNADLISYMTMNSVLELLPQKKFIQIHRSYIISIVKINKITAKFVNIDNSELPIGGKYRHTMNHIL